MKVPKEGVILRRYLERLTSDTILKSFVKGPSLSQSSRWPTFGAYLVGQRRRELRVSVCAPGSGGRLVGRWLCVCGVCWLRACVVCVCVCGGGRGEVGGCGGGRRGAACPAGCSGAGLWRRPEILKKRKNKIEVVFGEAGGAAAVRLQRELAGGGF